MSATLTIQVPEDFAKAAAELDGHIYIESIGLEGVLREAVYSISRDMDDAAGRVENVSDKPEMKAADVRAAAEGLEGEWRQRLMQIADAIDAATGLDRGKGH